MYDEIGYAEAAMARKEDDRNEYRQLAEEYAQELAAGATGADRLGARSSRSGSQAPTTGTAVQETGPQVYDDAPAVAGASPGLELQPTPGQARQDVTPAPRPASQAGLFAPPTAQETIAAERQRRQDEIDGRTGTGDTSMLAGEGELFAGPRPQQLDVEQETGRPEQDQQQREPKQFRLMEEDQASYGETSPLPDREGRETAREPSAADDSRSRAVPGQLDLFVHAGRQGRPAAQPDIPRLRQSARLVTTGEFRTGIERVNNWQDAAHVVAPLRKSPQEQLVALVLDDQNRPLAVIRHSIGEVAAASVERWSLVGAVAAVPGARSVYFAHNHPSGTTRQSGADHRVTQLLRGLLVGSGIEPMGMIVVAPNSLEASHYNDTGGDRVAPILPAARTGSVPMQERQLRTARPAERGPVTPSVVRQLLPEASTNEAGIVLLDSQQQPVGRVPMPLEEMSQLRSGRTDQGTARILREVARGNAPSAVIYGPDLDIARNLGEMLSQAGVHVVEVAITDGRDWRLNAAMVGGMAGTGRPFFSRQRQRGTRTPPKPGDQEVAGTSELLAAWTMVAGQEQAFQLPVSDSADIYTIFREVAPGFRVVSNEDAQMHAQSEGADRGWMIYTPAGREGVIFQRGGEVWINVSQSQRGEEGSRIYNAVANFAYNNNLVFTGDPAGLSDTAMYRRLENMLSSALKFGTTEHLYPHERQLAGNAELGVPALDWRIGDDGHNLHQLLNASYQAVLAQAPEIRGMAYNPDTSRFERADGSEVTDEQFNKLAERTRAGQDQRALEREARRAAGAGVRGFQQDASRPGQVGAVVGPSGVGRRTLKRAVLTHSLVSGTRESRSRLLARLGRERGARGLLSPALQKILYSWPAFHRPASRPQPRIKAADLDARVQQVLSRWRGDVPDVTVVQSARDLPAAIRRLEGHETAEAVYMLDGRVYLVADNLPSMRRAMQVLVHEAIGHHGIEAVVGPEQWAQIVADIETMRASGKHKALFEDVDSRYDRTDPAYYREVVAIMAERGIGTSVVDLVIAAVRRFLADLGLTGTMTEDRIRQVIIDAARHVRRGEGGMFAPAAADGARMSRTEGTRRAYERRIDELFAGTAPAGPRAGVRVLDRADVLDMLGLGGGPVNLAEGKVQRGQRNHPLMTAEVWKKIPEWLDNPAAVFDSDTVSGAMVLIAPETVGGATVRMTVEPRPEGGADVHILTNAYDAPGRTPFARWFSDGLGRYVDQKEFPAVLGRSGLQLPSSAWQNKPGTRRILTEKNLAGYRRSRSAFSFAGPRAANADTMALETAQQRIEAGENAEQVRQDTGWFRGADGKWRFEIDDSGARVVSDIGAAMSWGNRKDFKAGSQSGLTLGELLDHPRLFAAYPQLTDVWVSLRQGSDVSGSFRAGGSTITLQAVYDPGSDTVRLTDGQMSTLLHEVQHAIQHIEGFATGGNPQDAFADPRMRPGASTGGLDAAHRLLNERLAAMAEPIPIEQFAREGWRGQTEITPEIREHYDEYVADMARAARNPDMARHAQTWAAREWYQRLAGEVEARNVQTRQGMTADDRRATPPSATQDVADSDVIVVFNGQEMHSAPPPDNAGTVTAPDSDGAMFSRADEAGATTEAEVEQAGKAWAEQGTDSPWFQRFFGESKVVDEDGEPLVGGHEYWAHPDNPTGRGLKRGPVTVNAVVATIMARSKPTAANGSPRSQPF